MSRFKKWKIKLKIYSSGDYNYKNNYYKPVIKEKTKYRLCIYKIYINKWIKFNQFINHIKENNKLYINSTNYNLWKRNSKLIKLFNLFKYNLIEEKPLKKLSKRSINNKLTPIDNLSIYWLKIESVEIKDKYYNIYSIYHINNFFEFILWINYVKIDSWLLTSNFTDNNNFRTILKLIKKYQEDCKDIKSLHININYNSLINLIIIKFINLVKNYKFTI